MAFTMSQSLAGARVAAQKPRAARAAAPAPVVAVAKSEVARKAAALAAAAVLTLQASPVFAATLTSPPEFQDDTKRNAGVQLIYEARDLALDAKPRSDGATRFALQKLSESETKKRVKGDVGVYTSKSYWTQARNELRRQLGTARFDLDNLVASKGTGKYEVDEFIKAVEDFDFQLRKKDLAKATAAYAVVVSAADAVSAKLL